MINALIKLSQTKYKFSERVKWNVWFNQTHQNDNNQRSVSKIRLLPDILMITWTRDTDLDYAISPHQHHCQPETALILICSRHMLFWMFRMFGIICYKMCWSCVSRTDLPCPARYSPGHQTHLMGQTSLIWRETKNNNLQINLIKIWPWFYSWQIGCHYKEIQTS